MSEYQLPVVQIIRYAIILPPAISPFERESLTGTTTAKDLNDYDGQTGETLKFLKDSLAPSDFVTRLNAMLQESIESSNQTESLEKYFSARFSNAFRDASAKDRVLPLKGMAFYPESYFKYIRTIDDDISGNNHHAIMAARKGFELDDIEPGYTLYVSDIDTGVECSILELTRAVIDGREQVVTHDGRKNMLFLNGENSIVAFSNDVAGNLNDPSIDILHNYLLQGHRANGYDMPRYDGPSGTQP